MASSQFLGCHPLGLGAELVQCADFVGVERGMNQQPEAAGPEHDQVLAIVQGPLGQGRVSPRRRRVSPTL